MKRVLLVAYYFPPIGGAGSQRPTKFSRYLRGFGYDPVIVTGGGASEGRWTPKDPSLSRELPEDLEVIRIARPEPRSSGRLESRAERWLRIKSDWTRWWIDGVQDAARRAGDIDAIYAFMSPWASGEAASHAAAELGRPWVADLGDPWALDEMVAYPTGVHRRREIARMKRVLGSAAAIVMSTPEAVDRVQRRFPDLAGKQINAITNGFDEDDFEGPVPQRTDDTFRIVHTGYLHTDLGQQQRRMRRMRRVLGGEISGVNILTRSHVYLVQAIERLIHEEPDLADRIQLYLAGVLSESDLEFTSETIRFPGYLSHKDSIDLIRSADLLFLPMQDLPRGRRATIIPGKTYEYLAAGRPILAAVPEGDARDILSEVPNAYICDPDDVDAATRILSDLLRKTPPRPRPMDSSLDRYQWTRLTGRAAAVLDDVTATMATPSVARHAIHDKPSRILYIAYYFPPIGGAGTQRSLKFVRYLPDFGYDPVVITGPGRANTRWAPDDDALIYDIPAGVDLRRIPGPEPSTPGRWRSRAERWLRIESEWMRWWINGVHAAAHEAGPVDLIYVSMSPYVSAEAVETLTKDLGIPWVADLRDPWALDEMVLYPSGFHRRQELRQMGRVLRSASAIVLSAPEAVVRVRRQFPELADKQVVSITNGFDAADFQRAVPDRSDSAFRIAHTGYLHTDLGRQQQQRRGLRRLVGGDVKGVNILTRSHVYLLQAIEQLTAQDPSLASTIELHLAGVLSDSDQLFIPETVRLSGYLSHNASIDLVRSADLLFLPMQNLPAGVRATIVPGKTYEYLAAGPPILAAVPEGDARDFLTEAGNAYICDPDDVGDMAAMLRQAIERWRAGDPVSSPPTEFLKRFERRQLTARLVEVFDRVPAPRR